MIKRIVNCKIIDSSGRAKRFDIYVSKGRINALRPSSTFTSSRRNEQFNADGRIVLPGFIDCHCHLFSLGELFEEVNLVGVGSIAEMLERISLFSKVRARGSNVEWIFGRGWDQDKFVEKRLPSRRDLDMISTEANIIMSRICGHIAVMNSNAIEYFMARGLIGSDSPSALVTRERGGSPSGIVKESELIRCWNVLPKQSITDLERLFLRAQREALRFGLTGAHCILDNLDQLRAIRRLDRMRKIHLKLSLLIPIDTLLEIEVMKQRERSALFTGKKFRVLGFKLFADGSLGARTAALSEEYSDDPGNKGILYYSDQEMRDYAMRVKQSGLVLATHAIGDRAVEQTLRAYEEAHIVRADGFRIEHCSILRVDLLKRLSNVIACVQPSFATSDYWLRNRIGNNRLRRFGHGFKSLSRITLTVGSSDSPVESLDPLDGIASAISNRADQSESLSISRAIKLYTSAAARISPLTADSGAIEQGKDCDIVILEASTIREIPGSKVARTFIDGVEMKI